MFLIIEASQGFRRFVPQFTCTDIKGVPAGQWRRSFDLRVLKMAVNEGQQSFVALALEGHHVTLLGKAGTGKRTL